MIGWTTVWFKRIFFFLRKTKPTSSNKPFLWCFRNHQSFNLPLTLLGIHIAFMSLLSVKESADQWHCSLRGRQTKPIVISHASHTGFAYLPPLPAGQGVIAQVLFWGFPPPFFSFNIFIRGRFTFPNQLCRPALGGGPYLVTLDWSSYLSWKVVSHDGRWPEYPHLLPNGMSMRLCLGWLVYVSRASHWTSECGMYIVVVRDVSRVQSHNFKVKVYSWATPFPSSFRSLFLS